MTGDAQRTRLAAQCLVLIMLLTSASWSVAAAQYGTDAHTVTVQVDQITVMSLNQAALNMTIDGSTATVGQDLMSVADQTSSLLWGTNLSTQKITVNSSLAAPLFTLKAVAVSPTAGTAAPEVTLTSVSSDFILDVGGSSGLAQIRYTAEALASQGTGTDTHVITFTIIAQ